MAYKLTVNGRSETIEAPADMPLLWVVRDLLDLKGTKYGCGMSVCGMCTLHVDGVATRSCVTPVASVDGKRITTIEGLSADGSHPLQKAWMDLDVAQCGYCQAGQILSAVELLEKKPRPTEADVATITNLCRCGTYPRVRRAIAAAAKKMGGSA
jgi:isoquinoline 1-oxidoreductase alpha subunit